MGGGPARQLTRPSAERRLRQRAPDRESQRPRRHEAPGQPDAHAGPVDPGGVLGHVADCAARRPRGSRRPARAPSSRGRRGRPQRRTTASSSRRRAIRPAVCSPAPRPAGPAVAGSTSPARGSARRRGRRARRATAGARDPGRSTVPPAPTARRPRGDSTARERRLPHDRPDDLDVRRASRADTRAAGTCRPGTAARSARRASALPGGSPTLTRVALSSARPWRSPACVNRPEPAPQTAPERRPRQPRAERIGREATASTG